MKKILLTGFKGYNNSTQSLLNKISNPHFYFSNSFNKIKKEIKELYISQYDYVICFGQKPLIKRLYIELEAHNFKIKNKTKFPYQTFINSLSEEEYKISYNAGNYFCNHVYFNILKEIDDNHLNTKAIFVHIPKNKNINDIEYLTKKITELLDLL